MATHNQKESQSGPAEQVSDDDLLARLQSATKDENNPPVLSTSDVADLLPIGREATRRRLNDLTKDGRVRTYKAGRNPVWWPAENEKGGKIDPGGVRPDDLDELDGEQIKRLIDPSQVPKEFAQRIAGEKLENYSEKTKWDSFIVFGRTAVSFGFVLILSLIFANSTTITIPTDIFDLLGVLALLIALIGIPFWIIGNFMQILANREYVPSNRWPTLQEWAGIPSSFGENLLRLISWKSEEK